MRARAILWPLVVAVVVLCFARLTAADDASFKVIVHPDSSIDSIDRDFLRDAYLKKTVEWSNGDTIHPIDLSSRFPARDQFTERVVRKTPAQLRTYWNQQIFSGKGVPPPEADSTADVIQYVLTHKGAVGYVPIEVDTGRARVVRIR